jgi:hypothetical protein
MVEVQGAVDSAPPADNSALKRALILLVHQLSGTLGVLWWALVLTSFVLAIPRIWGHVFVLSDARRILLAGPYYPIHIVVGLLWGWLIWKMFRHRTMLWVWIFPLLTLVLSILKDSTTTSSIYPGALISIFRPTLLRYFGSACRIEDHCFAQLGVTLPFYVAVSYAIGGWLALRFPIRSRPLGRVVQWTVIMVGAFILVVTIGGVIESLGRWPLWLVLFTGALLASMGACLISFGFRIRRMDN